MILVHNGLEMLSERSDKNPRRMYCIAIIGTVTVQFEKRDLCIPQDVQAAQEILDGHPEAIDPDLPRCRIIRWNVVRMLGWGYFEIEVPDDTTAWAADAWEEDTTPTAGGDDLDENGEKD